MIFKAQDPNAAKLHRTLADFKIQQNSHPTHTITHTITHTTSAPRNRFKYRSRAWSLALRNGIWYLVSEHKGKRLHESCGESALKAAIITAKLKIDALLDGHTEAARLLMRRDCADSWPTVGALCDAFTVLPIPASTSRAYVNCLLNILRRVHGDGVRQMPATVINSETAHRWFRLARERALTLPQDEAARCMRTANSVFAQAKAMFGVKNLEDLRCDGIALPPCVTEFAGKAKEKTVAAAYMLPDADLIRRTLHDWLQLPRNEFVAVGLELSCGLRKSAIANLTWDKLAAATTGHARTATKDRSGLLAVRPIDPFWRVLMRRVRAQGWDACPTDYVLHGSYTERGDTTFRRISAWMRGLGWQTQKTNHAFRAYAGALVIVMDGQVNIYRGSRWLHHKSVGVTERHYAHFIDDLERNPLRARVRWSLA